MQNRINTGLLTGKSAVKIELTWRTWPCFTYLLYSLKSTGAYTMIHMWSSGDNFLDSLLPSCEFHESNQLHRIHSRQKCETPRNYKFGRHVTHHTFSSWHGWHQELRILQLLYDSYIYISWCNVYYFQLCPITLDFTW